MRAFVVSLPLSAVSLLLVASCGPDGGVPGFEEHPCKAENHCVREGGESLCEDGYQWEDPSDEDNYTCVEIGFVAEAGRTDLALPEGGHTQRGFYNVAGGGPNGSHNWLLLDMDGDRLPDLVIPGMTAVDGNDYGYGFPDDPHWRVYKNEGSGFAAQSTRFKLPQGGHAQRGFFNVSGGGPNGSHNWALMDMDGDRRPDLVLFGQTAVDGNDYGYGFPDDPHWRVFKNNGSGFAEQAVRMKLPQGGHAQRGFFNAAGGGPNGSHNWLLQDMNGDGKPDLVIPGQTAVDGNDYGYGFPDDPHWRVYVNDGAGFVK